MITVEATVVVVSAERVWVQAAPTGCSTCGGADTCGLRLLSTHCTVRAPARVMADMTVQIGDRVLLSVPEGVLWQGAVLVYVVPLLSFFSAAMTAQWWWGQTTQWPVALSGLIGLGLGFLVAHHCAARFERTPVVIARLGAQ